MKEGQLQTYPAVHLLQTVCIHADKFLTGGGDMLTVEG